MALKGTGVQRRREVDQDDSDLRKVLPYGPEVFDDDPVRTGDGLRRLVARCWEAGLIKDTDPESWEERESLKPS
eukprot:12887431-Prorocentrum_lima.AAC.1